GRSKAISGHGLESAGMVAPEEKLRGACSRKHTLRKIPLNKHQALGIRVRQGLQQHGVYDREDGAIDSDSERQGEKRYNGQDKVLAKYPKPVADILPAHLRETFPAGRADHF